MIAVLPHAAARAGRMVVLQAVSYAEGMFMNEMLIAETLLDQVRAQLPEGIRPECVRAEVRAVHEVDIACLTFAWEALTASTPLSGTQLCTTLLPRTASCPACNRTWTPAASESACICGSTEMTFVDQNEFRIVAVNDQPHCSS